MEAVMKNIISSKNLLSISTAIIFCAGINSVQASDPTSSLFPDDPYGYTSKGSGSPSKGIPSAKLLDDQYRTPTSSPNGSPTKTESRDGSPSTGDRLIRRFNPSIDTDSPTSARQLWEQEKLIWAHKLKTQKDSVLQHKNARDKAQQSQTRAEKISNDIEALRGLLDKRKEVFGTEVNSRAGFIKAKQPLDEFVTKSGTDLDINSLQPQQILAFLKDLNPIKQTVAKLALLEQRPDWIEDEIEQLKSQIKPLSEKGIKLKELQQNLREEEKKYAELLELQLKTNFHLNLIPGFDDGKLFSSSDWSNTMEKFGVSDKVLSSNRVLSIILTNALPNLEMPVGAFPDEKVAFLASLKEKTQLAREDIDTRFKAVVETTAGLMVRMQKEEIHPAIEDLLPTEEDNPLYGRVLGELEDGTETKNESIFLSNFRNNHLLRGIKTISADSIPAIINPTYENALKLLCAAISLPMNPLEKKLQTELPGSFALRYMDLTEDDGDTYTVKVNTYLKDGIVQAAFYWLNDTLLEIIQGRIKHAEEILSNPTMNDIQAEYLVIQ